MAGRTGYTPTPSAPSFQEHVDNVYEHFDTLVGESVATASALPASGNWPNRQILAEDTKTLHIFDGSSWIRLAKVGATTFTPTWTNLTIGGGGGTSNTGAYTITNGWCEGWVVVTLGTSPTVGAARFAPPVTPVIPATNMIVGRDVNLLDAGTGNFKGAFAWDGTGFVVFYEPASQAFFSVVSSTAPFTWAVGDSIRGYFRYPVA